jgi:hypothetical protein
MRRFGESRPPADGLGPPPYVALSPLLSILSRCTSSMVVWNVGTKFGANQNFLPPVMDTSLLTLD